MKQSGPLRRKTPLKAGGPLKRTALKRTRPKTSYAREKYRKQHPFCQLCDEDREEVHEIVTRGQNKDSIKHRCCFLALCSRCHRRCHDPNDFPMDRQLCLKQQVDPEGYDLAKVNELRGRGPNATTQAEVDWWRNAPLNMKGSDYARSTNEPGGVCDRSRLVAGRSEPAGKPRWSCGARSRDQSASATHRAIAASTGERDSADEEQRGMNTPPVNAEKVAARVQGRKMAVELSSLIPGDNFHDLNFMEALTDELKEMAGVVPAVNIEVVEQVQPIARLATTEVPFGVHKGKSFDDVPLTYLDWLCREQEGFYRSLRAYLKHPELKSRRRGID
jgi:hypothetical protein